MSTPEPGPPQVAMAALAGVFALVFAVLALFCGLAGGWWWLLCAVLGVLAAFFLCGVLIELGLWPEPEES